METMSPKKYCEDCGREIVVTIIPGKTGADKDTAFTHPCICKLPENQHGAFRIE